MKVKVEDTVYCSSEQPVMVMISENERKLISQMRKNDFKFCVYPHFVTEKEIIKFMRLKK